MEARKFKFRAYYKPDFKTKDGPLKFEQREIYEELFFVCEKDSKIRYSFGIPFADKNWIVQQSTGLKDLKGVEIYEGDIVKYTAPEVTLMQYPEEACAVEYKNVDNYTGWVVRHKNNVFEWALNKVFAKTSLTVIGNVFEQGELLK